MADRRILVTGASGFVGGACVAALRRRGWSVVALSRRPRAENDFETIVCDLLDPRALRRAVDDARCAYCLHLAWDVSDGYWSSPSNLDWVAATLTLARAFADAGGRRFVGAGTCAEYDWRAVDAPLPESASRAPHTLYGASKASTFALLSAFADAQALSFAWGVIFHIVGVGDRPAKLIPDVAAKLARGEPADCSPGAQRLDWIDVRDLGDAFAALASSDVVGRVNLGSGDVRSVADVARRVAQVAGRPELLRLGALPARVGEPPVLAPVLDRLRDEVGHRPAIDLDIAIADVAREAGR